MMTTEEREKLLIKWLNNEISPDELKRLEADKDFTSYKAIIHEVDQWSLPPVSSEGLELLKNEISSTAKVIPLYKKPQFLVAASILLLAGLFVVFVGNNHEVNQYITQKDEIKQVTLPDGSIVYLGNSSSLTIDEEIWTNSKTVLLEGKAYFSGNHSEDFTVETPQEIRTTVVGTSFEIKTSQHLTKVFCYDGEIESGIIGTTMHQLTKGKGGIFGNNSYAEYSDTLTNPDWINNTQDKRFQYTNAVLADVLVDLQYHYDIVVITKFDANRRFTGRFTEDNLESALQMICLPLKLKYKFEADNLVIIE